MKLNREFIKLPWCFDAEQLALEAQSFEEAEWRSHPSDYKGNSAISLVSADGQNNDDLAGRMLPTPQLQRCHYMQQVLASFGTVIGRSRLMRLAPQCSVPAHFDSNYDWFRRTRVHIPILTEPSVRFVCNGKSVHMAPGEAWIFDNWQTHEVIHTSDSYRIHLVFDACGSASFWRKVAAVELADAVLPEVWVPFRPEAQVTLKTEQARPSRVADPSEVELALQDLSNDVRDGRSSLDIKSDNIEGFQQLLKEHCLDWRSRWLVHGSNPPDYSMYTQLNHQTLTAAHVISKDLRIASNGASVFRILKLRLGAMVHLAAVSQQQQSQPRKQTAVAQPSTQHLRVTFHKPCFIVAAPRSCSTVLFETLSQSQTLWTVGGESHQHIESIDDLNPATRGYHSKG